MRTHNKQQGFTRGSVRRLLLLPYSGLTPPRRSAAQLPSHQGRAAFRKSLGLNNQTAPKSRGLLLSYFRGCYYTTSGVPGHSLVWVLRAVAVHGFLSYRYSLSSSLLFPFFRGSLEFSLHQTYFGTSHRLLNGVALCVFLRARRLLQASYPATNPLKFWCFTKVLDSAFYF